MTPDNRVWISAALAVAILVPAASFAAGFDPQAATDAYLASVPHAVRLRSDAYFEGGYWLILWNALAGLAVGLLLLTTRLSARMRDLALRIGRGRWGGAALYGVMYMLLTSLLTLPLDIYQGFFREHHYGLSNQTLAAWAGDDLTNLAVSLVFAAILLPILYAVIRHAPRTWWLWGAGVVLGFFIIVVVIGPVFLEPLLNHFQSLPEGPLRNAILSLARSDGVPATDVLEFDASRQTSRISAHVSGLFGTTRISLNDNLLHQCTPDEVLAVLGHEMGHYVMNHILNFTLQAGLLIAIGFALTRAAYARLQSRFGAAWGIGGPDDIAGLPLLVMCLTVYVFLLTPVTNSLTRMQETQADIFGLNLARRPDAFATVALKVATYRKLDPSPIEEFVFYDHPSGRNRIFNAMRWKAEQAK